MKMSLCLIFQGAVMIKNLAAKEPSALSLDTYYKQYYLCLAAAAAIIKWYQNFIFTYLWTKNSMFLFQIHNSLLKAQKC